MTSKHELSSTNQGNSPLRKKKRTSDTADASLVLVSWNIAECQPSNDAPSSFDAEEAICQEILRQEADILCLQECPSKTWSPYELLEACYERVGSAPSHCGYTQLWIKKHLFHQHLPSITAPSVGAMVLVGNTSVQITSSHLAPFKENASTRIDQVKALTTSTSSAASITSSIHAGDFNMRQAEDDAMEGLGLADAWKQAGRPYTHNYTWNSIDNKYHNGGFPFKCRFDRVYIKGSPQVTKFRLFAHQGHEGKAFYLSDHFGINCTLSVPQDEGKG